MSLTVPNDPHADVAVLIEEAFAEAAAIRYGRHVPTLLAFNDAAVAWAGDHAGERRRAFKSRKPIGLFGLIWTPDPALAPDEIAV